MPQATRARPRAATRSSDWARHARSCDSVRDDGDAALLELTERFDGVRARVTGGQRQRSWRLPRAATEPAARSARRSTRRAIEALSHGRSSADAVSLSDGRPESSAARVACRSRASGSTCRPAARRCPRPPLMLGEPARIAGCRLRVLCTPPRKGRSRRTRPCSTSPRRCGVHRVFKLGGAQAIAALAFGTETVPRVHKIFGPGNVWVTAAKQLLATDADGVACDLPAGPVGGARHRGRLGLAGVRRGGPAVAGRAQRRGGSDPASPSRAR